MKLELGTQKGGTWQVDLQSRKQRCLGECEFQNPFNKQKKQEISPLVIKHSYGKSPVLICKSSN